MGACISQVKHRVTYKVVYVVSYMSTATFVGHRLLYSKLTYCQ